MKRLMFAVTALCAVSFPANAQVRLTPDETYTHVFAAVPDFPFLPSPSLQPSGSIWIFVDTNSITAGAALRYEFFETGSNGPSVASGTIAPALTNRFPHRYVVSAPWLWQDREGGFRLTGLSGSLRIVGVRIDIYARIVPSDAFTIREYATDVELPPEPRDDLLGRISVSCADLSCVDICWPGLTNKTYQVQHQSNLTANAWINLGPPVAGNGTNCITDTVQDGTRRFYRIRDAE